MQFQLNFEIALEFNMLFENIINKINILEIHSNVHL